MSAAPNCERCHETGVCDHGDGCLLSEVIAESSAAFGRGWKLIVRLGLALAMTFEYGGRFPRRKVFGFYWQEAGRMVRDA